MKGSITTWCLASLVVILAKFSEGKGLGESTVVKFSAGKGMGESIADRRFSLAKWPENPWDVQAGKLAPPAQLSHFTKGKGKACAEVEVSDDARLACGV